MRNEKIMDRFMHPRNGGEMPDAEGVGGHTSDVCGDLPVVYIKVNDGA